MVEKACPPGSGSPPTGSLPDCSNVPHSSRKTRKVTPAQEQKTGGQTARTPTHDLHSQDSYRPDNQCKHPHRSHFCTLSWTRCSRAAKGDARRARRCPPARRDGGQRGQVTIGCKGYQDISRSLPLSTCHAEATSTALFETLSHAKASYLSEVFIGEASLRAPLACLCWRRVAPPAVSRCNKELFVAA